MTTIATDGKSMAGDGYSTWNGTRVRASCVKVRRLDDGRIFGAAGEATEGYAIFDWLNAGAKRDDYPQVRDAAAIVLNLDGTVDSFDERSMGYPDRLELPISIGTGEKFARGAMLRGASPQEAVEIASLCDPYTGGMITVLDLQP